VCRTVWCACGACVPPVRCLADTHSANHKTQNTHTHQVVVRSLADANRTSLVRKRTRARVCGYMGMCVARCGGRLQLPVAQRAVCEAESCPQPCPTPVSPQLGCPLCPCCNHAAQLNNNITVVTPAPLPIQAEASGQGYNATRECARVCVCVCVACSVWAVACGVCVVRW
jgi:hypothetical protein